jgi:hypothetical protein
LYVKEVKEEVQGKTIPYKGKHYQVVGTFNSANNMDLQDQIIANWETNSENGIYVSEISTVVTDVRPGRLEYERDENGNRDYSNIKNLLNHGSPNGRNMPAIPLLFGVSNGISGIETNMDDVYVYPLVDSEKKGGVYALLPSGTGIYIPVGIHIKSFGELRAQWKDDILDFSYNLVTDNPILKKVRGNIIGIIRIVNDIYNYGDIDKAIEDANKNIQSIISEMFEYL